MDEGLTPILLKSWYLDDFLPFLRAFTLQPDFYLK